MLFCEKHEKHELTNKKHEYTLILIILATGIAAALPEFVPTIVSVVVELCQTLVDNLPLILDAALQLITGLEEGLIEAIPILLEALPELIISIVDFLVGAIPQIIETGITLFTSIIDALPEIIQTIITAINCSTVTKVNDCREELRELMKYIDRKEFKPIISDFDDEITTFTDAVEDPVDFTVTIDDFKTLEEKTIFFIHSNPELSLVNEIQNLIKPTLKAIADFKKEVIKIAKTAEEYNELFKEDEDLVVFVRKNIEFIPSSIEAFLAEEKAKGFNDEQLKYIKELLLFISQNGDFKRNYLLRPELLFGELFNSSEINNLIVDIESRI